MQLNYDSADSFTQHFHIKDWDSNWNLIVGHSYLIKLFLFGKHKRLISLTENIVFSNIFPNNTLFNIIKENKINSEIIVEAISETHSQH